MKDQRGNSSGHQGRDWSLSNEIKADEREVVVLRRKTKPFPGPEQREYCFISVKSRFLSLSTELCVRKPGKSQPPSNELCAFKPLLRALQKILSRFPAFYSPTLMPISILSILSNTTSLQALLNPSFVGNKEKMSQWDFGEVGNPRLPSRLHKSMSITQLENSQWPRVIPLNLLFRASTKEEIPAPLKSREDFSWQVVSGLWGLAFFVGHRGILGLGVAPSWLKPWPGKSRSILNIFPWKSDQPRSQHIKCDFEWFPLHTHRQIFLYFTNGTAWIPRGGTFLLQVE